MFTKKKYFKQINLNMYLNKMKQSEQGKMIKGCIYARSQLKLGLNELKEIG